MLGVERQHPFRHAAPRTGPQLPIWRRTRLRGSEIVHLPARYDSRLSGDLDAAGIRICESPGNQVVRLWNLVLRITACERRQRPPDNLHHGATVSAGLSLGPRNGEAAVVNVSSAPMEELTTVCGTVEERRLSAGWDAISKKRPVNGEFITKRDINPCAVRHPVLLVVRRHA